MSSLILLISYVLLAAIIFFLIAFGVKYGILWAVRAMSEDDLTKLGKFFKR